MEAKESVFEVAGGMDGFRRLAAAWHRLVMADEVVSHAFSHGFHPEHVERLSAYWAEALGGPNSPAKAAVRQLSSLRTPSPAMWTSWPTRADTQFPLRRHQERQGEAHSWRRN